MHPHDDPAVTHCITSRLPTLSNTSYASLMLPRFAYMLTSRPHAHIRLNNVVGLDAPAVFQTCSARVIVSLHLPKRKLRVELLRQTFKLMLQAPNVFPKHFGTPTLWKQQTNIVLHISI